MSKMTKFLKSPYRFFADAFSLELKTRTLTGKPVLVLVNFTKWKRETVRLALPEYEIYFVSKFFGPLQIARLAFRIRLSAILVWGMPEIRWLESVAAKYRLPIWRMEDGFLRSNGLGAHHVPPMSLCLDRSGIYFDCSRPSDLEKLMEAYDFAGDAMLMERARSIIERMIRSGLSKYNGFPDAPAPGGGPYVLVIGQCEDDASIKHGSASGWNNRSLAELAIRENPGCRIIYRPHPDVVAGRRRRLSDPESLVPALEVVPGDVALASALAGATKVYTITSLAGFEAVLRGIPTVVTGMPFYAGWGVTDDRAACPRRVRRLAPEEIFAAAYLMYPRYFDPSTGEILSAEAVVERLGQTLSSQDATLSAHDGRGRALRRGFAFASIRLAGREERASASDHRPIEGDPPWYSRRQVEPWAPERRPFLFMPAPGQPAQRVIDRLMASGVDLEPVHVLDRAEDPATHALVSGFARSRPEAWRKLLLRRLIPVADLASGLVVTSHHDPASRELLRVARTLDLPTVLLPADLDLPGISCCDPFHGMVQGPAPLADYVFAWCDDQARRVTAAGFPPARVRVTGTPCLERAARRSPHLARSVFARVVGLDPARPIILFLVDDPAAGHVQHGSPACSQERAIVDCLEHAEASGVQVLFRFPASSSACVSADTLRRIANSLACAVDGPGPCVIELDEALYHAAAVVSCSGAMLLDAALAKCPSVFAGYDQQQSSLMAGFVPTACDAARLRSALARALSPEGLASAEELAVRIAATMGLVGPGWRPSQIVSRELSALAQLPRTEACRPDAALEMILDPTAEGWVVHTPSMGAARHETAYLPGLLGASSIFSSTALPEAAKADVFVQWGLRPKPENDRAERLRRALGRPRLVLEDGFIRSLGLGLSREPTLSVVMDDLSAYYDAVTPSRLCLHLNSSRELTTGQAERARDAIRLVVTRKVSKYNHAPITPLSFGRSERRRILLVDQRYGDQSVVFGCADEASFQRMLEEALSDDPRADILLKRHPDAISGGRRSYFSDDRIARFLGNPRLHLIDVDANPYCLFEAVDEVRVVTSGVGFEALMAGLPVHCYGAPYYAGWGLTQDRIAVPNRSRRRSLEAVFHAAFIEFARYWQPEWARRCELEDVVEFIARRRGWIPQVEADAGSASQADQPMRIAS